jgi:hypothetical protein
MKSGSKGMIIGFRFRVQGSGVIADFDRKGFEHR